MKAVSLEVELLLMKNRTRYYKRDFEMESTNIRHTFKLPIV